MTLRRARSVANRCVTIRDYVRMLTLFKGERTWLQKINGGQAGKSYILCEDPWTNVVHNNL